MRRWELTVALDPSLREPLFLQLASAVAEEIRCGRLHAGEALPGSRELAGHLGVNRNTVVAGYEELAAEGLVTTRVGGGTFVAASTTAVDAIRACPATTVEKPTYPLIDAPTPLTATRDAPPGALNLATGGADARLFPGRALARAFRRAISTRHRHALGNWDPCGHERLRAELATMLARSRGLAVTAENLMVTHSIEQAIDLVARALIAPGDVVAVEQFGYPLAWNVLKLAGATLVPVPVDDQGLDVDALLQRIQRQPIRAVFLTPHHQFPTAAVMPPTRRRQLAQLALQHRFAIIEDDYDHEFHYTGKPLVPIAAGSGAANVIYLCSLANLLAPGIGTGFVTAPAPVFAHLRALRASSDARCDAALQCAIAELFEDGELLRHVRRTRRTYAGRRDALAAALQRHLGNAVSFRLADGGMGLWVRADPMIDVPTWQKAGEREGIFFHAAACFDFDRQEQHCMRLNFGSLDESELTEAARRMARALTRSRTSQLAEQSAGWAATHRYLTPHAEPPERRQLRS